ncbi:MAG: flippase [Candidatus Omnitrophota bacterium]
MASLSLREFINKGAYLLLGIAIARGMGREAFGTYALSLLLPRSFFTIADLGFGTWLVREVSQARSEAGRYFGTIGVYRILSGICAILCLWVFVALARYHPLLQRSILLSGGAFFFLHLASFVFNFFRAFEQMECELQVSAVRSVLLLGGGLWAILSAKSLVLFFYFFIAASVLSFMVALFLYQRRIGWSGLRWAPMALEGVLSIWLIQSVVMVYLYLTTVLLSFFRGIAEVGLYQAAYSFVEIILIFSTILTTALFPVFSRLAKGPREELLVFYDEAFHGVLFFSVPLGVLALFGGETLLMLFYGASFRQALPALYVLLSGFLFFVFGGLNSHLLVAMGKEKIVLGVVAACTVFNLILNFLVIPRFGFMGASLVTFFSEMLIFILMLHWIAKSFKSPDFLRGSSVLWMGAAWMFLLAPFFRYPFWALSSLGLIFYGVLAFLLRRHLSKELRAARDVWKELRER